jgi:predicted nucleotidyltransferase component of viral defense system
MKEQLKEIVAGAPDEVRARSLVREYCQARILQFLQEKGAFRSWIFHGGTALRFLYMLPRFSEDLDFALAGASASPDFSRVIAHVRGAFEAETYDVKIRASDERTVKSAYISFPGLLYELGLSGRPAETLSVRVELDSRPPAGAGTQTSVLRRFALLNVMHYDKASFLSGKLHAILMRPYVKGRDLYDLLWYLSDRTWPAPNITFLGNALKQTKWRGPEVAMTNWPLLIAERIRTIDWKRAVEDVRPFIERSRDLDLMTKENVLGLLKERAS